MGAPLFSVHYELKALLYGGVLLLSGGLGIALYKNIDTIGHGAVLLLIFLISAGCFAYCQKVKPPFTVQKAAAPNPLFDYALLLGCLTFATLIGYAQAQYTFFGDRYGLALALPMIVFFFSAYWFDHLGVLSLAIANGAAWCGVAVTPDSLLARNDFGNPAVIGAGLLLGGGLQAAAYASRRYRVKAHFSPVYLQFGVHLLFISCLAALFTFDRAYIFWFALLLGMALFHYRRSLQEGSFYFLVVTTLYTYIGASYVVMQLLFNTFSSDGDVTIALLYFIASAVCLVSFLISSHQKLKAR